MDDADLRVSSAERQEALAALVEHHAAGRLDAFEYEDRRGRATDAVVRRDLLALFVDLPEPRPRFESAPTGPGRSPQRPPSPPVPGHSTPRAKVARTLLSLAPFIALAAFFVTKEWPALLLIPIIAIVARYIDD